MFLKSREVQEKKDFIATNKTDYDKYLAIAMRLQSRRERPSVSDAERSWAEDFTQRLIEAGVPKGQTQILDRPIGY